MIESPARRSVSWIVQGGASVATLACLLLGGFLASRHPIAPVLATAAFALACVGVFFRPALWLFAVPALVPAIGFAPWTGWIAVEEVDVLILATAAGGYAALAFGGLRPEAVPGSGPSRFARALVVLYAVSVAFGIWRGIAAADVPALGWFDGYDGAINSVRIAKGYLFALLLMPLLVAELQRMGARAAVLLGSGLAAGAAIASAAVVWERLAFPGFLNFSTRYRVTAPFWEMHVGGAALDGFLALTVPFLVWPLVRRSTPLRLAAIGVVGLVAAYACLATFSRGVYLALPVSFALLGMLLLVQRKSLSIFAAAGVLLKLFLAALAFAAAAYVVFRAGGYRSLLAVLAALALTLPIGSAGGASARSWGAALILGGVAGAIGGIAATEVPKGIYLTFALAFVVCAALVWAWMRNEAAVSGTAPRAAYVWVLVAAVVVAGGWGGAQAARDTSVVVVLLLFLAMLGPIVPGPHAVYDWRRHGAVLGAAAVVSIVVAVFSGGAVMGERFGTSERDFGGRLQHWRDGLGMLDGPVDWAFGKGLGRFPSSYALNLVDREHPGSYHVGSRTGNRFLALYGPRHESGWGEMLRVSQRIGIVPGGNYSVVVDARAPRKTTLHLEICEQYLIYNAGCAVAALDVTEPGNPGQRLVAGLDGRNLTGGPWYAPRLVFFAMAVETPGAHVEIDGVSLIGPDGREVLVNGNFAEGMSRWFFTSDWLHLPWHIKNVGLNVLFDQGVVGLLLFALLACASLARTTVGAARGNPAAPFLAAALAGFLVVGAFDSLLDVPRVAFLFWLLVLAGLTLPAGAGNDAPSGSAT